ncbi:DNA polymerase III subunit chi [Thalassotalea aquiviva]|uniref:DNA polymerase III subunit chi n=1 Tax=Thalassotalea aquiviva TaxID=3242415 RepID=UPI00352B8DA6
MPKQVVFHLLAKETADDANQALLQWACELAAEQFRAHKRVFIYTDDQQTAHAVDELLWSFDSQSFVPHNLPGEDSHKGSPVEISWQPPINHRHILINLSSKVPTFATQFSQILDFVPAAEELTKLARLRYRQYQQTGFELQTRTATQAA